MRLCIVAIAMLIVSLAAGRAEAALSIYLCSQFEGDTTTPEAAGEDVSTCSDVVGYTAGAAAPAELRGRVTCDGVAVTKVIDRSSVNYFNRVFNRSPLEQDVEIKVVTRNPDSGEEQLSTVIRLTRAQVTAVRQAPQTGVPDTEEVEFLPETIEIEIVTNNGQAETVQSCQAVR